MGNFYATNFAADTIGSAPVDHTGTSAWTDINGGAVPTADWQVKAISASGWPGTKALQMVNVGAGVRQIVSPKADIDTWTDSSILVCILKDDTAIQSGLYLFTRGSANGAYALHVREVGTDLQFSFHQFHTNWTLKYDFGITELFDITARTEKALWVRFEISNARVSVEAALSVDGETFKNTPPVFEFEAGLEVPIEMVTGEDPEDIYLTFGEAGIATDVAGPLALIDQWYIDDSGAEPDLIEGEFIDVLGEVIPYDMLGSAYDMSDTRYLELAFVSPDLLDVGFEARSLIVELSFASPNELSIGYNFATVRILGLTRGLNVSLLVENSEPTPVVAFIRALELALGIDLSEALSALTQDFSQCLLASVENAKHLVEISKTSHRVSVESPKHLVYTFDDFKGGAITPMSDFCIKQNDNSPVFRATLTLEDGTPVDLSAVGVTATLKLRQEGQPQYLSKLMVLADAVNGVVEYELLIAETADFGNYRAEIEVFDPNAAPDKFFTFPTEGYIDFAIIQDLDD